MTAYDNEHEPYAAQWLRNLIAAGHIAPGDVDARDIQDVTPDDLTGYTQCHLVPRDDELRAKAKVATQGAGDTNRHNASIIFSLPFKATCR